ncbi:MAG: S1C family serine protease [Cellulosilyticaceae bacterium]
MFNQEDQKEVQYYVETIKPEKEKKGLKKFVVGMLVASLVGGGSIGASFAVVSDLMNQKQLASNENTSVVNQETQNSGPKVMPVVANGSISEIANNVGPSIVSIINNQVVNTIAGDFSQQGLGSGVIFYQDDQKVYIVTNAHVVEGASNLVVTFLGNTKVKAELVGMDSLTDIAVISVNQVDIPEEAKGEIKIAPLGDSDTLQVGDLAMAMGTPIDEAYNNTLTVGVISALNRTVSLPDKELNLIQTDAAINPGNSGGALIGPSGEVVGINTIKLVDSQIEGMGFSIPINDVKPIIEEIITTGKVARPTLGISGTTMTQKLGDAYEIPVGVYVATVTPGGSAELAGIQPKDIILEFDGTKITSIDELKEKLQTKKVGEVVVIRLIRGAEKIDLQVQLQEAPAVTYNS